MGRLGKDNSPAARICRLWPLLALAACASAGSNGRYAGAVTTQTGLCGLASGGKPSVGSLQIRRDEVVFAPDEGTVVLHGRIDSAGHVVASMTTEGADHKPFVMAFEGYVHDSHVEGQYATPRCRAVVRLDRVN